MSQLVSRPSQTSTADVLMYGSWSLQSVQDVSPSPSTSVPSRVVASQSSSVPPLQISTAPGLIAGLVSSQSLPPKIGLPPDATYAQVK